MPYGNQSPLLGSTIDPSLFIQDFSGFAEASRINAAGMMGMVNQVSAGYQEHQKQQKDQKNALKSSAAQIQAASTLFPEMKPMLEGYSAQLNNEEIPISERAAIASQISNVINLGVDQMRYNTDLGFKKQDQQNQNQESAMRQWAFGQEVSAVERQQNAQQLDTKTKATIGPALLQQVIAMAPKGIADQVKAQAGDYSPDEQYQLAASVMSLIPKAERKKAPATIDVAVPGGSQKMQWDEARADWVPIQTAIEPTGINLKATSYGYTGDPTPDSNSSAGIGAWVPDTEAAKIKNGEDSPFKLKPNDIALSPDVEKTVRANGIQPGDTLAVTMGNGDIVQGRWMDRTAQDSDVSSGKIKGVTKPLRGRVDFYTPGGVNPYDGMGIKGIAKVATPIGFTPDKSQEMSVTDQIAVKKYNDEQQAAARKDTAATAEAAGFVQTLDELEKHPGFNNLFGSNVGTPTWWAGSAGADAKAILGKVQGKAFLEAIQKMKGMGALSEKEGETATKAYSALSPSMSEDAAKKEIASLKQQLSLGIARQNSGKFVNPDGTPMQTDPFASATQRLLSLPKQ